ncbi:ATP-binding protein [Paraburkholderia sp. BCC1886]|uniref:ATP-binding protein n=1 Tax=Paraburkholderia sp. BCC1886 TaxID=2562670 RepID=UPI0011835BCE|nr:ATP-binding protein [Paraburkholderia sp. BCC1886]
MRLARPRSLLWRNVLLLIVLTLASQTAVIAVYLTFIQKPRIDDAAALVASQIIAVNRLLAALPEPARDSELLEINGAPQDALALPPAGDLDRLTIRFMMQTFLESLASQLPSGAQVRWDRSGEHRVWVRLDVAGKHYWVKLHAASAVGHILPWSVIFILLTIATFPVLGGYLIQRPVEGALRRLARAASTIERGQWPQAVPVTGSRELATVAEAFNRMVAVLADLDATRTEMLAGISHDIRTPLTKLRMAIAAPEAFDAPLASAERFIGEIDVVVQQFIDFARGWESEPSVPGDLNDLIEQLAGGYAALGHPFELVLQPLPRVSFRRVSVQRMMMNLMQNAVVYGGEGLVVRTTSGSGFVALTVEDRGPGVPDATLPLITQPFRRGAQAEAKSGTGLGLAIAERIARQHGGYLQLAHNQPRGLSVTVRLRCE